MCSASNRQSRLIAGRLRQSPISWRGRSIFCAIGRNTSRHRHYVAERLEQLKDVPTTAELGMPEVSPGLETAFPGKVAFAKGTCVSGPRQRRLMLRREKRAQLAQNIVAERESVIEFGEHGSVCARACRRPGLPGRALPRGAQGRLGSRQSARKNRRSCAAPGTAARQAGPHPPCRS